MTFVEIAAISGIEAARKTFRLTDHAVYVITPKKHVELVCGNWRGSEPLGGGENEVVAVAKLAAAICGAYKTCEVIYK